MPRVALRGSAEFRSSRSYIQHDFFAQLGAKYPG